VFPIGNISADVTIRLIEEYTVGNTHDVMGVVVLPITRYMGVMAPTPPKIEWLQFFPYREVLATSGHDADDQEEESTAGPTTITMRSGDAYLPGSAMNKCKQSLGFICVEIEVFLVEPAYKLYLKSYHPDSRWTHEHEVCMCIYL
jgi:hypothetical protein